jgi:hypothetical protein
MCLTYENRFQFFINTAPKKRNELGSYGLHYQTVIQISRPATGTVEDAYQMATSCSFPKVERLKYKTTTNTIECKG